MTGRGPGGPDEVDRSDHQKHMDYVQAVITRLANNSFLMKGWALTLSSALLGFAVTQKQAGLALTALVPAMAFWALDTYYLRLERAFRNMYADIAAKTLRDFKIEPKPYVEKQPWKIGLSISLAIFYLTVIALTVVVAIILAIAAVTTTGQNPPQAPAHQVTSGEQSPRNSSSVQSRQPSSVTATTADTPRSSGSPHGSVGTTMTPETTIDGRPVPTQPK